MAELSGVNVEKLQGGLGRLATGTDNHFALIVSGIPAGAVATAINAAGKGLKINSLFAAEQIGINVAFDANNSLNLHADIVEFFRLAPEATLYLFNSVVKADLKAFINQNKEIKGYGFTTAYNVDVPNIASTANAHQTIINEFATENRLIDFCFIGFNELSVFTLDLFTLTNPNVSIIAACSDDSNVVQIGSALGMQAIRKVNENLGSVNIINKPLAKRGSADYPLTDATLEKWLNAYLPDGRAVESIDKSVLLDIISKGYIVAAAYEGYAGFFLENSYTCIARDNDFGFVENNRTWNKAARIVRVTLLPEVKGVVKKDPATGYIAPTTVTRWSGLLNKALERMIIDDEISGFEAYIEQKQLVNGTNPVKVKVTIVADGIVHEFDVAVGLTNNI